MAVVSVAEAIGSPVESQVASRVAEWDAAWGDPSPFYRRSLRDLKDAFWALAAGLPTAHPVDGLGELVHAQGNHRVPVHRWYAYKEAFAPELPRLMVDLLGCGASRVVLDPFAGVGTTPLSLQWDTRVESAIGVEYSPFAHFAGMTKLNWWQLDPARTRQVVKRALKFGREPAGGPPGLAAFSNRDIFSRTAVLDLVAAREHIERMRISLSERNFLMLGLAAVLEDVSNAVKDGRALRIVGYKNGRRSSIQPRKAYTETRERVRTLLGSQWNAMVDDLADWAGQRERASQAHAYHACGDARDLGTVSFDGTDGIDSESVGLVVGSPPYLNCIDYTEIYKLELWLLGLVTDQEAFRSVRLGTLRSHPSVEFPRRGYLDDVGTSELTQLVRDLAQFVEHHNTRPAIGRMIENYFDDMYQVLREQYRSLEPGGHAVIIIANSTFSRRDRKKSGEYEERWRVPVLTDVIVARLGELVGFDEVTLWPARELRPRNVASGAARESVVVLRKS